jgi:H+/Cl- antiporter ClcA
VLSIIFCKTLHLTEYLYKKYLPNVYARAAAGGLLVVILAKILGTTDYLGAGGSIIELAIEGETAPLAFLMKIIFTALTLEAGFKGGEIVPTLFVGATFGCLFGNVIGFEPSLCAACGMLALFSAMTNSPLATLVLGFELFGFEGMPFYLLAVAIGYLESGYYGLYKGQKIIYSKIQPEYINQRTKG